MPIVPGAELEGTIVAVSRDDKHHFSKPNVGTITLVAGTGIEGDAHAGVFVKHRWLAKRNPTSIKTLLASRSAGGRRLTAWMVRQPDTAASGCA